MRRLAAALTQVADLRPVPSAVPSILALPRRKYELETEIAERVNQLFMMGEGLIRYDLAILLSLLPSRAQECRCQS